MRLHKYNNFLKLKPINENLDKSKKFLKERAILKNAANKLGFIDDDISYKLKEGEIKTLRMSDFSTEQQQELSKKIRETRLSDEEVRNIERDPEFLKLRELIDQNIGFLYTFVYMYYVEKTPFNEIESLYNDVLEYRSLLDKFREIPEVGKNFDANFIDTAIPNEKEHRTNSEILADGLEKLKDYRKVKKIIDTLPSKLKNAYRDAPVLDKQGMVEIAIAFDDIPDGDKPTDEKDHTGKVITKKERVWKNFFGEMKKDTDPTLPDGKPNPKYGKLVYKSRLRRFETVTNPIREMIRAARAHLSASVSDGYTERLEKIDKCNDKFGVMGCEIKLHEGGIMIVQINSYAANQYLNSHCNHCIVNYSSYWNSYLGDYNKQYYIYNFNISHMDDLSTIGVTIDPSRNWPSGACQTMRNNGIGGRFKSILKEWQREYNIETDLFMALEPMTKEEIDRRQRAKLAEREIIRKGITIEQIKQYVTEDGADINKDNSKALINAVEEDDYEKVKLCLSLGASPNLSKGSESAIARAQNINMIKLLVTYGSDMTGEVFNNIINDMEALEFCLKAGLDPNFSTSMPFRKVCKGSWVNRDEIGESYLDAFKLLVKYGGKLNDDRGRNMIVKYAADYGRIDILEHLRETGLDKSFTDSDWEEGINWLRHARKINDTYKEKVIDYLKSRLKG
jgi:hypothetical protein